MVPNQIFNFFMIERNYNTVKQEKPLQETVIIHPSINTVCNMQACPWEWDSHGNHPMGWDGMGQHTLEIPMGWDGTAHICICHGRVAMS